MSAYALFLHADAAAFFHGLRREEKEPLRRFFDLLEQYPTTEGEATERDTVGRAGKICASVQGCVLGQSRGQRSQSPAPRTAARRRI